jgi:transcriptional regulator NrdR family protein
MNCPKCSAIGSKVFNSRKRKEDKGSVWRRRKCYECDYTWSTVELQQEFLDRLIYHDRDQFKPKEVEIYAKVSAEILKMLQRATGSKPAE